MKKVFLLGVPLVMVAPLMLLILGTGNASIESVRAACNTSGNSTAIGGSMGIGTLNWRGAAHYKRNPHPGERPYHERVPHMLSKITASGASILGFQEFEPPQARAFLEASHGWALVKGMNGRRKASTSNAIAYQLSAWTLDETRYVAIRYGGPLIQVPLARFTSTSGLGSIWVLNTHNPAGAVGGTDAMRDAGVRAQARALTNLQAAEPNTPLILTGDMNDKQRFKRLFLSLAPGWSTANPTDRQIDWIMGSPAVSFSATVIDQSTNDGAHSYTDHPFVYTTATLAGATSPADAAGTAETTEDSGSNAGVGRTGSGTVLGQMPTTVRATPGAEVSGTVTIANATFKGAAEKGLKAIHNTASPDFITLNEVGGYPAARLAGMVSGYGAYKDPQRVGSSNTGQSMGNAIMWRTDTWRMLDGGRVKIVAKDQAVVEGKHVLWDGYATWAMFQRVADGAVVSVIATQQMADVFHVPRQWGEPPMTRVEQYGLGMDYLIDLTNVLAPYGPVLLGGDMHSRPGDDAQAAALRMEAAGFRNSSAGTTYQFYKGPATVARTWRINPDAAGSAHPVLLTRLAMNDAGPQSDRGRAGSSVPAGCPCPSDAFNTSMRNVAAITRGLEGAKVAAAAALQAGFRGEDLVTAVAIARVESSWNPKASNNINGGHYGLWQISSQHKGKVPGWNAADDIFDPLLNAQYAFYLFSGRPGSGEAKFADWIPFETTDYHQFLETARQAVAAIGGGATYVDHAGCNTAETGGVSGDRLDRLRQRAEMVIKLAQQYSSPCSVPGYDCQGVGFSGWSNACTAISMMIYGNAYVGSGDGGERAYGSVVQGQQGSSWPPPPGAIVSWPYSGSGHVAIYLGEGSWVDNWGPVGHNAHDQVERGATAHWLLPPPDFEGTFLNNGIQPA